MNTFINDLLSELSFAKIIAAVFIAFAIGGIYFLRDKCALFFRKTLPSKPILILASTGGTCRDPMAKAIVEQALGKKAKKIKIIACGIMQGSTSSPSKAARIVLTETYGIDLLKK